MLEGCFLTGLFVVLVAGCRSDSECSGTHTCINHSCVPACSPLLTSCGRGAECLAINHKAICECPSGYGGNPKVGCMLLGCRSNSDCPTNKACINNKCENPCSRNPCTGVTECYVDNHAVECTCPHGYVRDHHDECVRGINLLTILDLFFASTGLTFSF